VVARYATGCTIESTGRNTSEEIHMYARIVRFTDATPESVANVIAQVEASDGPPPGINATGMKLLHDADQGTAVFMAFFDTAEDMHAADETFKDMDAGETPGTRASIDLAEVAIERDA
jgi:hypothetical protein